jgi:hypothetical protein
MRQPSHKITNKSYHLCNDKEIAVANKEKNSAAAAKRLEE